MIICNAEVINVSMHSQTEDTFQILVLNNEICKLCYQSKWEQNNLTIVCHYLPIHLFFWIIYS